MTDKPATTPHPGLSLGEILYIIFRHKWKIALISAAAVLAAFLVFLTRSHSFQSEARLYIRYVLDTKTPNQVGDSDSRIRSPDSRGDSIINTELQILTSRDLAQDVAKVIGPEKILGPAARGAADAEMLAAAVIQKSLVAEVPRDSSVIRVLFTHTNPEVVQPVLEELIRAYIKKHALVHAVGAFDDFLMGEKEERAGRLADIEERLRTNKAKAGVISLEDSKRNYSEQVSRLQQQILDGEAELAERRAAASEMAKAIHVAPSASGTQRASTNYVEPVPSQIVAEYRRICGLLENLERREQELLVTLTPSSSLIQAVRRQIETNEQLKKKLESANPGLHEVRQNQTIASAVEPAADPRLALNTELARISGLESRLTVLTNQLHVIQQRIAALDAAEGPILDLQRKLQLEETNYARFSLSLEQSQIDEKLGAGKVSNISTIQQPTPPLRAPSKTLKLIAVVLFGGIAAAFGLAFLIEFYLDQSLKRPGEVEAKIGAPLFMSIPLLNGNGTSRSLHWKRIPLLPQNSGHPQAAVRDDSLPAKDDQSLETENGVPAAPFELAPWDSRHGLRPFSEALRDRLMTYFELKNMSHKPKLVAVTSCAEGSGVSTIAAGLAASLSETGDGNVLLVDMNLQNGAAHEFYKGDLGCGLDEALEAEKRDTALVQDNLYVVKEGQRSEKLPGVLPKRFKNLVPKLKASDYDYIIFDMPPVSQISLTPRLSRFMDIVLMVVEAEKTDREVVKRATSLLAESKANVGVVLNKSRTYVPKRLQQEL